MRKVAEEKATKRAKKIFKESASSTLVELQIQPEILRGIISQNMCDI